jgi:dephospho-CoA kinase
VAGASGAGKTWVCNQLKDAVEYVAHDKVDKKNIRPILWNSKRDLVLYDPTTHVSSFIKRNSDIFEIELVVIQETQEVIEKRLIQRGGKLTDSVKRRISRMRSLAKKAIFTGTSEEVLTFLSNALRNSAK